MPHTVPLPEPLRREYLKALGIDCYMPRVQLPGAPVSNLAIIASPEELNEQATAQAVQPTAEPFKQAEQKADKPVAPASIKSAAVTPDTDQEKQIASAVSGSKAKSSEQPQENTRKSSGHREEVKLQLLCIRVGEGKNGAAVIAAMPHLGPAQLSARHQGLLVNLLRACGIPAGDLEIEEKPFRWPMVTGLHVDNSRRAAASALKAYLQQKHADWQFGHLLVMGEGVVSPLFEPVQDKDGEQAPKILLEKELWNLIYTRSLDELLQRPTLKKDAWLAVRKGLAK